MTLKRVGTPSGDVSVEIDGPAKAKTLLFLAPGAGAGFDHPFMAKVAADVGAAGITVCRFNFVYAEKGRKAPDKQPILESTYGAVVDQIRETLKPKSVFLGGKSMGGRIASYVAIERPCKGLVFLGYPLHPPGRPDRIRDAHLAEVPCPMLFVEGTRDPFCPLETLSKVIVDRKLDAEVAVIDGGDHSFKVPRSSGRSTEDALGEVADTVVRWVSSTS